MSDTWFTEKQTPYCGLTMAVTERLFDQQSAFQRVEVFQTPEYGRVLTLDGCVMVTERDEFVYHEMIAHPALLSHPSPRNVLIIGGGDGGSVREVCRHPEVERVDLVEIDPMVIDVSRQFFPSLVTHLDDPRVTVTCMDGFEYLDNHKAGYDVILTDSMDPVGEAAKLFSASFFEKVRDGLRTGGTAVFQSESFFFSGEVVGQVAEALGTLFKHTAPYLAYIPTYPSGVWSFTMASDRIDPPRAEVLRRPDFLKQLKYFNPELFRAAFALPNYMRAYLKP